MPTTIAVLSWVVCSYVRTYLLVRVILTQLLIVVLCDIREWCEKVWPPVATVYKMTDM